MKQILPFLVIVAGGCQAATDIDQRVGVTMSIDHEIVSSAAPVNITVTVVNRGTRDIQTEAPYVAACVATYLVLDGAGREVKTPGRVCTLQAYSPVILRPGQSLTIHDSWSGTTADGSLGAI